MNLNFLTNGLEQMSAAELKEMAKNMRVKNWWTLKKADLIKALTSISPDNVYKHGEEVPEEQEILNEENNNEETVTNDTEEIDTKINEEVEMKEETKKETKKVKKEGIVTLAELVDELIAEGYEPVSMKKVRRLLRKDISKEEKGSFRWEFPVSEKKLWKSTLETILSPKTNKED